MFEPPATPPSIPRTARLTGHVLVMPGGIVLDVMGSGVVSEAARPAIRLQPSDGARVQASRRTTKSPGRRSAVRTGCLGPLTVVRRTRLRVSGSADQPYVLSADRAPSRTRLFGGHEAKSTVRAGFLQDRAIFRAVRILMVRFPGRHVALRFS